MSYLGSLCGDELHMNMETCVGLGQEVRSQLSESETIKNMRRHDIDYIKPTETTHLDVGYEKSTAVGRK